ncbi:MAG: Flp pilus assembly protein CpaB [Planctomycetota bacterium]|jgi:pilus assembly protein CpaB
MKWTVVLLVLLGVIASVCAVMLVNAVRVDDSVRSARRGEIPVVMAIKDLPAMSIVTADAVEMKHFKKSEAPLGAYSNPAQVIGKILAGQLKQGQAVTKSDLVAEGRGAELAADLPPGMRAISINMSSQAISGGMLYPGCVVDVLASFKLSGSSSRDGAAKGEALSTTLLQGISVLAVAGESVVSTSDLTEEVKEKSRSSMRNLTVTLRVDPRQAEALQLAALNGTISLALRNPLDEEPVDYDATVLNRGKLTKLGALLGSTVGKNPVPTGDDDTTVLETAPVTWDVTVIRGNTVTAEEVKNEE